MLYCIPNYINYSLKNCYLRTAIIFLDIFIFFFFSEKRYANKNVPFYYCFFNYI